MTARGAGVGPQITYAEVGPAQRRRLLAGAYLAMIGLAACSSPIAVCLTSLSRSFPQLSTTGQGLLTTTCLLGVVVGILASGPAADRWGLRPFMILGALLEIAGLLAISRAPTVALLLVGIAVVGVGIGVMDGLTSPLAAELEPDNRTRALNWLHACYPIGFLLMTLTASHLLTVTDNWRVVFPAISLPTVAALVMFAVTPFPRHEGQGEGLANFRRIIGRPLLWIALLGIFLAGASEMGVAGWAPAYTERVLGRTRETGAHVLLGFAAAMILARLSVGALARRLRPLPLLVAAALLCLAALLGTALGAGALSMASMVTLGLAVSCMWPTVLAYAADRVPGGGATLFTLLAAIGNVGAAFAPFFIGAVAEHHGLRHGMLAAALFPLLAVGLMGWRAVRERTRAEVVRP
jgi:fucose permease